MRAENFQFARGLITSFFSFEKTEAELLQIKIKNNKKVPYGLRAISSGPAVLKWAVTQS